MKNILYPLLLTLLNPCHIKAEEKPEPALELRAIIESYNNATCCIFIDQMEKIQLGHRKSIEVNLYESNKLIELSTGPAFAVLIEIPLSDKKERYYVQTKAIQVGDDIFVYFPYLATLDKELNLIGSTDFTWNQYESKNLFQLNGEMGFSLYVEPNSEEEKATRFLLVYTRAKHFTKKNIAELNSPQRSVQLKEVSIEYADVLSGVHNIKRDLMYGLPGAIVTVSNRGLFF